MLNSYELYTQLVFIVVLVSDFAQVYLDLVILIVLCVLLTLTTTQITFGGFHNVDLNLSIGSLKCNAQPPMQLLSLMLLRHARIVKIAVAVHVGDGLFVRYT